MISDNQTQRVRRKLTRKEGSERCHKFAHRQQNLAQRLDGLDAIFRAIGALQKKKIKNQKKSKKKIKKKSKIKIKIKTIKTANKLLAGTNLETLAVEADIPVGQVVHKVY